MPPLGSRFSAQVDVALALSDAAERIREFRHFAGIKGELTAVRMETLYEMSFLRIFASWEAFIEDSFLHMLCGFESPLYIPQYQASVSRYSTLALAQAALFGSRRYLLWYDPARVQRRCSRFLINSPPEMISASYSSRLEWFAFVRNRIAHDSEDARSKFDIAAINIAGRRYPRSRPGKLLRSSNSAASTPEAFLITIAGELKSLAVQIAP